MRTKDMDKEQLSIWNLDFPQQRAVIELRKIRQILLQIFKQGEIQHKKKDFSINKTNLDINSLAAQKKVPSLEIEKIE